MFNISKISLKDISKQNQYNIQDYNVYTPYQIYESQNTFIAYILRCLKNKQHALIQSPTGTGKTISLLCSTLAWVYAEQQRTNSPPPQIIYASRTHAQLKQVVSELNKLCYNVKLSILSSRDQSCANEDLKLLRGQDKQLQCRLRIAKKKGLSCNYYQSQIFYSKNPELGKLLDLQQITLKAKLQTFCPFFYERYSRAVANIVLIPYNYLFDKKVWTNQEGFRLEGSILILDEAHNIQSVCQQYREYSLTLTTLTRAIQQAEDLRVQKLSQNKNKLDPGVLDKIKMMKLTLQDIQINASYIQKIYSHLQMLDIPSNSTGMLLTAKQFIEELDKATGSSQFGTLSRNIKELIVGFQNIRADLLYIPFWALENWMRFIQKINQLMAQEVGLRAELSQFTIQILYQGADIKVNIYCLDPSSGFKEVIKQHKPRSIILTSGTLSPLKVWPLQLGIEFSQPVSCPHVLSPDQVNTIILSVGPSGNSIDTKYESRKQIQIYEDIGEILFQIIKNTPNGVVALFPSYNLLQTTKNHLTTKKILTKMYQKKNVYFQRKDASDFTTTLQRYMKDAQTQKGALLFALVRGRVSQGLDFAHKKCRAIIMVGVPYPSSKDVKIVSKRSYLDNLNKKGQKTLTGDQWYLSETIRAINQGIGRLIRTPDDFGSVYLIDSRFARSDIQKQLASWARVSIFKIDNYIQFIRKIQDINRVKYSNELFKIPSEMGLVSTNGTILGQQSAVMKQKKTYSSISRQIIVGQNMEELNQGKSLQAIIASMKNEKQIKDQAQRLQEEEVKRLQKINQLYEKQKKSKERQIFRRTVKPIKSAVQGKFPTQVCPVCQVQSLMVKSNTCHHSLCQQCWDKWLQQDLRCPICRGRVRKNFLIPQNQDIQSI